MEVANIGQAVSNGDLPNPCYIIWNATCLMKVYVDEDVHADIPVCNLSPSQTPENCYPYIYEGNVDNDELIINNAGLCIDEETDVAYDLLRFGIGHLHLVDNSEDWFTRLQYYFDY